MKLFMICLLTHNFWREKDVYRKRKRNFYDNRTNDFLSADQIREDALRDACPRPTISRERKINREGERFLRLQDPDMCSKNQSLSLTRSREGG